MYSHGATKVGVLCLASSAHQETPVCRRNYVNKCGPASILHRFVTYQVLSIRSIYPRILYKEARLVALGVPILRHHSQSPFDMKFIALLVLIDSAISASAAFVHPGLLHTAADFTRVTSKVNAKAEPWLTGWNKLINSTYAQPGYTPRPVQLLCRGSPASCTQNYPNVYRDAAAAYALAIRYKVTGDAQYGNAAATILNAWSSTLTEISGNSDKYLASGLYGYQLANAAELLRGFSGFSSTNFTAITQVLVNVFYPMNHRFLVEHNDAKIDHYWANWDLCNM